MASSLTSEQEGQEHKIALLAHDHNDGASNGGDDPEIVKIMIKYLYSLDYSTPDDTTFSFGNSSAPPDPAAPDPLKTPPPARAPSFSLARPFAAFGSPLPATPTPVTHVARSPFTPYGPPGPGHSEARQQPTPALDGRSNTNLPTHAKIFAIAVKYQVPALQALAASRFQKAVDCGWDHSSFAETITLVYTSTPEETKELRKIVMESLDQHDSLLDKPEIEAAVCEINTLAFQLLKRKRKMKR